MAKQVVAAMDIEHNTQHIKTGDVIDPKDFTKEQLTRLYERGAVKIQDSSQKEEPAPTLEEVTSVSSKVSGKETGAKKEDDNK